MRGSGSRSGSGKVVLKRRSGRGGVEEGLEGDRKTERLVGKEQSLCVFVFAGWIQNSSYFSVRSFCYCMGSDKF